MPADASETTVKFHPVNAGDEHVSEHRTVAYLNTDFISRPPFDSSPFQTTSLNGKSELLCK